MPKTSNTKLKPYQYSVSCSVEERKILDKIEFSIHRNSTLLIIGPGGSGKSTLLYLLAGKGNPELTSQINTESHISAKDIGFLSQATILPECSYSDLLAVHGEPTALINDFWKESEALNDLTTHLPKKAKEVPVWIRRLFIFTLFAIENQDKAFWFLDEPEQGMNDKMTILARKISEFKLNKSIIVVTHNISLTNQIADHVLYLHYGNQRAYMPKEVFFNSDDENIQYTIKMGC